MNETYSGHGHVLYASKAFSCKEMCRICKEEGMGLDGCLWRRALYRPASGLSG